ncbi:MAG: hypothetical protein JKY61_09595 [Planctomycetes bacterium]|nr:hypothetical protein [Planctomycetota bacterium]
MTRNIPLFTPSLLDPETLARLTVGRESILAEIQGRITRAASSLERNHTLIVGPRGAGKTQVITLLRNWAQTSDLPISISSLPEDPWRIASYEDLLQAIAKDQGRIDPDQEENVLEQALAHWAKEHGPIVLFCENLDQILKALGSHSQKKFRSFLQGTKSLLLVASTTALTRDLADQAQPFYAFFTTQRLEPLDIEQATEMLARISSERGDLETANRLRNDPSTKAKVRAIAHLAGGQPRIWAALANALTLEDLDDLVNLLLTKFDDLTPYYQERMSTLTSQERRIVAAIADLDHLVSVKELAAAAKIEPGPAGRTIKSLTEKRWIQPTASPLRALVEDRRLVYYELAEPLARIAFQLKEANQEPIQLVVDFLSAWFSKEQLKAHETEQDSCEGYLEHAIRAHNKMGGTIEALTDLPTSEAPNIRLLAQVDDALAALEANAPELALALPSGIRQVIEGSLGNPVASPEEICAMRLGLHSSARSSFDYSRDYGAEYVLQWRLRAEQFTTESIPVASLVNLAIWHAFALEFDDAATAIEALTSISKDAFHTPMLVLACAFFNSDQLENAIDCLERLLEVLDATWGHENSNTVMTRCMLMHWYVKGERTSDASTMISEVAASAKRILGPDHSDTLAILELLNRLTGPDDTSSLSARN